jgi:hypothetical protein
MNPFEPTADDLDAGLRAWEEIAHEEVERHRLGLAAAIRVTLYGIRNADDGWQRGNARRQDGVT